LGYAAVFCIALIPFFAFQEMARILGRRELWDLFFGGGGHKLIKE